MSIVLARAGFEVTAIDYSQDAIALAKAAKNAAGGVSSKITFLCDDLIRAPLEGTYDAVVAADVIEHLAPSELDELYRRIAGHLSHDGLFVLHTFPNAWYYRYEHSRKLRIARSVGAYLPLNPRSRYEQLMHINEQSPRVLRRQLRQHFPHVLIWFSDHDIANPYENLRRKFSIRETAQAGDLFAVASNRPFDASALWREFQMEPASSIANGDLVINVLETPKVVRAGSFFSVDLLVRNQSHISLKSCRPHPIHLSYHWLDAASSEVLIFDGERTNLDPPLKERSERRYSLFVKAPFQKSKFCMRATLVQELVQWFDAPPVGAFADIPIDVI